MQTLNEIPALLNAARSGSAQLRPQMRPDAFNDIEVLTARGIIHNWMKVVTAKYLERTICPEAFLVILDKLSSMWQSPFDAFSQPPLCMQSDHLLKPALVHVSRPALRRGILWQDMDAQMTLV